MERLKFASGKTQPGNGGGHHADVLSITHAGRTTSSTSYTLPLLVLGGAASPNVPAVDPLSGPAQVNDQCGVQLTAGAFPPVGVGMPVCAITSPGIATVQFAAFLSGVPQTALTFNVFWRG